MKTDEPLKFSDVTEGCMGCGCALVILGLALLALAVLPLLVVG